MDPYSFDARDFEPDEDSVIHAQYLDYLNEEEQKLQTQEPEPTPRRMPQPAPAWTPRYAFGRRRA